eukprot:7582322-Pyramimonas_sp.AAC.1
MGPVAVNGQRMSASTLKSRTRRNLILALTQRRRSAGKAATLALIRPEGSQRASCTELTLAHATLDQRAEHNGAMSLPAHARHALLREGPPAPPPHVLGAFVTPHSCMHAVPCTSHEHVALDGDKPPESKRMQLILQKGTCRAHLGNLGPLSRLDCT